MADVLRHSFVFLQFSEENILVELEDFLDVAEQNFFLALDADGGGSRTLSQLVEEATDTQFEIFDVRSLRLKQLGHDEPVQGQCG